MAYQGVARVAFNVLASGEANNIRLLQSTGHDTLDTEALRAGKRAHPFPPFPDIIQKDEIMIEIDIVFFLSSASKTTGN